MTRAQGVVLEKSNGWAVILSDDGQFKRVKVKDELEIGALYYERSRPLYQYALVAAVVLMLTIGMIDFYSVKAYARVSSMLELGVNRWERVIVSRAMSDEGEKVLSQIECKGKKLDDAVVMVVNQALQEKRVDDTEPIKFSISLKNSQDKKLEKQLIKQLEEGLVKAIDEHKVKDKKLEIIKHKSSFIPEMKNKAKQSDVILELKEHCIEKNTKHDESQSLHGPSDTDLSRQVEDEINDHKKKVKEKIEEHKEEIEEERSKLKEAVQGIADDSSILPQKDNNGNIIDHEEIQRQVEERKKLLKPIVEDIKENTEEDKLDLEMDLKIDIDTDLLHNIELENEHRELRNDFDSKIKELNQQLNAETDTNDHKKNSNMKKHKQVVDKDNNNNGKHGE